VSGSGRSVLYVLKRYPRPSQTFIVRELVGLEAIGVRIGVDSLGPGDDDTDHPELAQVRASVRQLPRSMRLRSPRALAAHVRVACHRPFVWIERAASAARSNSWARFVQAGIVADRVIREDFDHVHAHFATTAAEVARDAARLSGRAFTVTAHARDIYHAQHARRLPGRLAEAAGVVTVSGYNVSHLRRVAPGVPVHHVPNGVPVGRLAEPARADVVLCVARLVPKKGIDLLIEAVARLTDRIPALRLEIIGDGPLRRALEVAATDLGIADRTTFTGALGSGDVSLAYGRAAMVVLPCRIDADGDRDGLPTVLVEALAHGVPVISTDVVGIGEVVRDGDTGLLVPPEDVDALANAIEKLWFDRTLRTELGAVGRELVADRLDPARCARQLQAVFCQASA
jgi:colanic acid/amylovoran biosynthesis glycosyltransferase